MNACEQENRLLEAENQRLTQEIDRQARVIRALESDPAQLHSMKAIQDDQVPGLFHVVHGSPEGIALVVRALAAYRLTSAESAGAGMPR